MSVAQSFWQVIDVRRMVKRVNLSRIAGIRKKLRAKFPVRIPSINLMDVGGDAHLFKN
jgi:hypothetical protein